MGDVIGDLNKRRGLVQGMDEARSGARIVKAMVPLSRDVRLCNSSSYYYFWSCYFFYGV